MELKLFKEDWANYRNYIEFRVRPVWERIKRPAERKNMTRKNCLMPFRRLAILSSGDILPCCVSGWHKPMPILGNVNTDKLLDVWMGLKIKVLRNALSRKPIDINELPPSCQICDSREAYKL